MRIFSLFYLYLEFLHVSAASTDQVDMAFSQTVLNKADLLHMHERIHAQADDITKSLKLSPQRQAAMEVIERKFANVHEVAYNDIETINEGEGIGKLLYQSDIVLKEWQLEEIVGNNIERDRRKRQAFKDHNYPFTLWPQGEVYFSFHSNTKEERIEVIADVGCWSYIGNLHEVQKLSLGNKCEMVGIALHEIGHALGFHHTHARHDRDQYVMVDIDAVQPSCIEEFNIEPASKNDNYGIPYDYGSVMHYNCRSFAKDKSDKGNRTMVPHEPEYVDTLGSHFLSFYEKLMMNIHYKCFDRCKIDSSRLVRYSRTKPYDISGSSSWVDKNNTVYDGGFARIRHGFPSLPELKLDWGIDWGGGCFGWSTCFGLGSHGLDSKTSTISSTTTTTTTSRTNMKRPSSSADLSYPTARCEMGGFPNPKDCTKCVCPDGYGGRLCKRRPKGCGKVLRAKTDFRLLEDHVGYEGVKHSQDKEDFEKCIYWIKAPKGRKIEVALVRYDNTVATNGCYFAGIEIKTQKDQRATGYRICSPAYEERVFTSESNIVPVITYSRVWKVNALLKYRMV